LGEGNKRTKEFKNELREAARLFDEHSKVATNAAVIIGNIKENNKESIIQIDAYEEQQKSLANLYYMFSRSIDDMFGHTITPQSFVNYNIEEELAKVLYEDLLRKGILKKPKVKKKISEEELKTISSDYGVSVKTLTDFLYKYEGKEIDGTEFKKFQKALKEDVLLPRREEFWKLLIQGKVLSEDVKYVVVNNERLEKIDPSLLDRLNEKMNQKELEKQTLELKDDQILLMEKQTERSNAECVTQQTKNGNVLKKK
jgi:predicted RNA-binding protein